MQSILINNSNNVSHHEKKIFFVLIANACSHWDFYIL